MQDGRDGGVESMTVDAAKVPTLPLLLNILWRRRWIIAIVTALGLLAGISYGIVVNPLYRATAVVRPGTVAFSPEGGPVREWQQKDILNWFGRRLYWQEMRTLPSFKQYPGPPHIMAEYIPSGGLYQRAGDIIILDALDRDPQQAIKTLDVAIGVFEDQADSSSSSSTLSLTRAGITQDIVNLEVDRGLLVADQQRLDIEISRKQREIQRVVGEAKQAGLSAERAAITADLRRRAVVAADSALAANRSAQNNMAARFEEFRGSEAAVNLGETAQALADLQIHSFSIRSSADSTSVRAVQAQYDARWYETQRDDVLAARIQGIEDEIRELQRQRDGDVVLEIRRIDQRIATLEQRLTVLTPLERIGVVTVSAKPVRPRKLRAAAILTAMAFGGSLFLALVLEYLQRWQRVVLAANRHR